MPKLQIFVCCHREAPVPAYPFLTPIQVGAALTDEHWAGFQRDDEGENISGKNRSYCELTALYWAWKHSAADYVGLFHYRRYLLARPGSRAIYRIADKPTEALLRGCGYDSLPALVENYDAVLPRPERMYLSVREHYAAAPHHRREDLALMERLVRERWPDYAEAAERYLSGDAQLFGNILILRRAVFQDYCAWLFPLLAEFDRRAAWEGRSAQEMRVDGYLAERLLGVYMTRHAASLRVLELPRLHFDAIYSAPDRKKRLLTALLPPGTRRRAAVKQFFTKRT